MLSLKKRVRAEAKEMRNNDRSKSLQFCLNLVSQLNGYGGWYKLLKSEKQRSKVALNMDLFN